MNPNLIKLLYFLLAAVCISNIEATPKSMEDFRHNISKIDKRKPFVFWRFLEMYTDAEQRSDQVKIMKDYYIGCSEERYRLPSLMFMYNAFDPLNPAERKRMIQFIKEYLFENHVLGLFLYRYGSYEASPPLSFVQLCRVLIDRIKYFSFPDLESLHFMDLMISQEITETNVEEIRNLLTMLWRNEITRQSKIYQANRHWFKKVYNYTSLGLRNQGLIPLSHRQFMDSRRKFFDKFGYSPKSVIENLELTFRLNDAAFRLPAFLPRIIVDGNSRITDQNPPKDSPFIPLNSKEIE
tara:strand:- start:309 stop:1193 length:885 start_codon:yes stop_codon:yes gene_type:complete